MDGRASGYRHSNCILDIAWDGATTGATDMVAVGGESPNSFFVSHDSGDTWSAINTGGRNIAFGFGGFNVYPNSGQIVNWDAEISKFIAVGEDLDASLPVICTSADGDTWNFQTVAGQTGGRFLCFARGNGIYVAACWFGGIGGHSASQIFSSADLITWTSRFTTGGIGDRQYPWIKYNGTDFLILSVAGNGNSIYSADGIAFNETGDNVSPNLEAFYGIDKAAIWDTPTSKWIVSSLGPLTANGGIFTAATPPATFATAYSNPYVINTYAGSVVRAGTKLVAFMSGDTTGMGTGPMGPHLESTDGVTWTPTGPILDSQYFAVLWDGAQFVGYRLDAAGVADNEIATSPDASTWTNRYDDADADILNIALFGESTPPPPPPPEKCVDFEIQSPGDMPDSGAQFTGQRLYIAVDCWKSRPLGSPEKLTPTIIVDGVETILPQITNRERTTIELPISQHHGRFFDGVRLDGCLMTSRVEIYGIWADVWLGEQSESS